MSITTEQLLRGKTPGGWDKAVHLEEVWGTVVVFDIRAEELDFEQAQAAVDEAVAFLHQVDRWFSTYKIETPISALRMGFADLSQMPAVVREVLDRCAQLRELTEGTFDPWAVPGGVDPSGFVKGWAADVAADLLVARGHFNVSVNAAGDIACRGFQDEAQPWLIGIRHPYDETAVAHAVPVLNQAIATSGEYERGHHIVNPFTGSREMALTSATVIGPDAGMADALATALLIAGTGGVRFFAGLPDWSGYLIEGESVHYFGPAFAPQPTELAAIEFRGKENANV